MSLRLLVWTIGQMAVPLSQMWEAQRRVVEIQNESPQDIPLRHVDYFEPKATVTL